MQQVNLYLPEFRPKRIMMSARQMGLALALCLSVLVIFSLVSWNKTTELKQYIVQLQNKKSQASRTIDQLKLAGKPTDQDIDNRIAAVRQAIARRQQIKELIVAQNLGNAAGFSAALTALAAQSLSGIALENIRLSDSGKKLELSGRAANSRVIPRYLAKLESEDIFALTQFGMVSVVADSDNVNLLRFSIGFNPLYTQAKEHEALQAGVAP